MKEKSNESTPQRPEGERAIDAALVSLDLTHYMEEIKKEPTWKDSDRNAITIFKSDHLRLLLIALHSGAEMPRHTASGIINLQILEGHILFQTDQQSADLKKGQVIVLHEGIPHSVTAKSETVFLLSISVC
jgi:quercetin dioxygenase-like cupin family protein